jgi:ankyrin repeat protein
MASSTTAVLSTSGTTTTPLLLLLDGLLAQDVEPIKMSLAVFRTTLRTATRNNADMMTSSMVEMPLSPLWSMISPFLLLTPHQEDVLAATDSISIPMAEDDDNNNNGVMATQLLHSIPLSVSWIRQLLYMFPQWAQTSNTRDGSLPLHLAASLGNVDVASVLLHHVCLVSFRILEKDAFCRRKKKTFKKLHTPLAHRLSLYPACLPFFCCLLYFI